MSVTRIQLSCDGCPWRATTSVDARTPQLARVAAAGFGWTFTPVLDRCPQCSTKRAADPSGYAA